MRPLRRLLAALVVSTLAAGAPAEEPAPSAPSPGLGSDAEAVAEWQLAADGKFVAAREAAEARLRRHPQSFEGHFVLGLVLHMGEGNLPRALHHLRAARRAFEGRYGLQPPPEAPFQWHVAILAELASVLREMDRFEEALLVLEMRDAAYDPDAPGEQSWSLIRLRRYAAARAAIDAGLASTDPRQVEFVKTALCALESEQQRRRPAYEACVAAMEYARAQKITAPNVYTNAAQAAQGVFRADEAERYALEGTRHFEAGNAANPWMFLLSLYLDQGRMAEAVSAARNMAAWRNAQPAHMDDQTRSETEMAGALLLYVFGHAEESSRITARNLRRPDRTGFTSASSEQMEAGTALLDRAALLLAAERKSEEASWATGLGAVKAWLHAGRLRLDAWTSGRRAASLVGSETMLLATLRPFASGSVSVPTWLVGDLVAVLGPGVVSAAAKRAQREEDRGGPAGAYVDAVRVEAAVARGDWGGALGFAGPVLATLPRTEALLRARVAALAAEAAWQTGDAARTAELYSVALQLDPGVVRRLGLAIPVVVQSRGTRAARRAARVLRQSPRFRVRGDAPFALSVGDDEACLVGGGAQTLACARVVAQAGEDDDARGARLAAALHEEAFAPRADLSQADIRSLDGSTTAGRERNARRLRSVIDELGVGAPDRP